MTTIAVYKTDVDDRLRARSILQEIRRMLPGSDPSLDLEDCDRVLRVETPHPEIDEQRIHTILKLHGHEMEVLP